MLRITGDIVKLFKLARATNSQEALEERLTYLHEWGETAEYYINVALIIREVNIDKLEADVGIKFFTGDKKPEIYMDDPTARMVGGLNLYQQAANHWNWSVNT